VSTRDETPRNGAGASIQFNGDECFHPLADGNISVSHHGRVTVTHAIKRVDLVARIVDVAPETVRHFGGIDAVRWPIPLGSTADFPALIDNLFVWSCGVEQAKRSMRGESLLPSMVIVR